MVLCGQKFNKFNKKTFCRIGLSQAVMHNFGAKTLNITTLSIKIFSITTLSIKGLYVTLSISDTQHNNALPLWWVSRFIYYYAEGRYAKCWGAIILPVFPIFYRWNAIIANVGQNVSPAQNNEFCSGKFCLSYFTVVAILCRLVACTINIVTLLASLGVLQFATNLTITITTLLARVRLHC